MGWYLFRTFEEGFDPQIVKLFLRAGFDTKLQSLSNYRKIIKQNLEVRCESLYAVMMIYKNKKLSVGK